MANSQFITIPNQLNVSIDERDGHILLTSNDNSLVLKVDKNSVKKEGNEHVIGVGTTVEYIKGSKTANNITDRIEIEISDFPNCSDNKKYCQNGITLCCEQPHAIVGTCTGNWSDC